MIWVYAISTAIPETTVGSKTTLGKGKDAGAGKSEYTCPVYKYPKRSDKYLIFKCQLKAEAAAVPMISMQKGMKADQNWKLKGVTLLCCKEWVIKRVLDSHW